MATGAGWQHYYNPAGSTSTGKYNSTSTSTSTSTSFPSGLTLEYTQDLHLKMSKKIAQLTKVIYALNTKNDEHEAAIQTLKEAHEEEVQQILSETREKIMQYKSKISDEMDLKRRIQSLEESMELHERMKRQALTEFETYRQRVEDMQLCTEAQHTQRVVTMSREVEEMRRSFEEKLRSFGQLQSQFEQEKQQALEELHAAHRQEVQELLRSHQSQNANYSKDQEKLGQLHKAEVDSLTERVEELKQDKKRLVEEYEAKLNKAQAFYERELEAMKRTQQMTAENLLAWKKTEAELRKEFQAQEAALQKTLGKLRSELQRVQEEARESREKSHKLQASLIAAESNIKELDKQLEEVTKDTEIVEIRQREAECELEASRDRVQQQATEILLKASQIGSLQATQMTHEAVIRDLESEKSRLKDKVLRLEEDRGALQKKCQTLDERQRQQILSLEKSLREEKQIYEKELMNLCAKYEEDTAHFKDSHSRALDELSRKHRAVLENTQSVSEKERNRLLSEMEERFKKERSSLEEQKSLLREELDSLREELAAKLNMANSEVNRLQELTKQGEQGLSSAEGHISNLKDAQKKLLEELDATRARLRETSNLLTALQGEMESKKQEHDAKLIATKGEEKLKMDKMALELELKWTEALRISLLKQSLEMQLSQSQHSLQQLQAQFSQEREHLGQQLQEMELEHQRREQRLQEAHCCAIQDMQEARQHDLKVTTTKHNLPPVSRRDCTDLYTYLAPDDSSREKLSLRLEMITLSWAEVAPHRRPGDEGSSLRSELNHLHASAIEHMRQIHQQETAAAKQELENALEQSRVKERELLSRISDLQEEVSRRKKHIANLDHEIHTLNENISTLTKELELKGKEVLKIRSEANQQIRAHEQDLFKKHEREMAELNALHHREAQNMLSDFNKAQELLKDKISALQILLEGTEDKFRNRESRPEDLQTIAELKDMVAERESLVKKLVDDKKFYQLELVNRETNFNKIFNTNPNVGVINPLVKQKRKNDKSATRFSSSANLRANVEASGTGSGQPQPNRLEPIPNSPIHQLEPNTSKPLPPPTPLTEPKKLTSPPEGEESPVTSPDPQRQEWFAQYFSF
ncbi:protein FAM184A-like [Sinocyclocheilus rhinocerous]|uniref:protein FAM184A-like n=1 Tax=Sinocyclocheilus rhinocerous TaxID=307959 RepID=UPI0007BAD9A1|nr:PREDICTED: protein FAM184A-like [Sinocyclocheilus rhinocerous]